MEYQKSSSTTLPRRSFLKSQGRPSRSRRTKLSKRLPTNTHAGGATVASGISSDGPLGRPIPPDGMLRVGLLAANAVVELAMRSGLMAELLEAGCAGGGDVGCTSGAVAGGGAAGSGAMGAGTTSLAGGADIGTGAAIGWPVSGGCKAAAGGLIGIFLLGRTVGSGGCGVSDPARSSATNIVRRGSGGRATTVPLNRRVPSFCRAINW